MEDNEMTEPTRPNLPEGYRWADELAKEALDGIGADDKTMAYEAAEHLAENIEDPYPQDTISEIADSYVNCYKAMRRKWLLADEDHLEAFENAIQEGLVDMNGFDLDTAIGVGWCQYNEDLLNSHAETINHAALYLSLSELVGGKTYFALSPKVIEAVEQMPFDDDFDNLSPSRWRRCRSHPATSRSPSASRSSGETRCCLTAECRRSAGMKRRGATANNWLWRSTRRSTASSMTRRAAGTTPTPWSR